MKYSAAMYKGPGDSNRDFRVSDHSDSSLVKSSRRRSIQEIRFLNIANIQIYNNQSEITIAPKSHHDYEQGLERRSRQAL